MMSVHAEAGYERTHGGLAVCNRRESSLAETEESKGAPEWRVAVRGKSCPGGHWASRRTTAKSRVVLSMEAEETGDQA